MFRSLSTRVSFNLIAKNNALANSAPMYRHISSDSESDREHVPLQNLDTLKCINRVTLLGRATGPALSSNSANTELTSFVLATNEVRRNRANELIKRSEFHRVQIFIPRLAQKAKQVIDKGSRILVEGKINYNIRKSADGSSTHFTNIIADNIVFITGKSFERDTSYDEESHEKMQ